MKLIFIIFLINTAITSLFAEELKFLSAEFPPYSFQTPTGGAGVIYDIAIELKKRVKNKSVINFTPWARARLEAENNPNIAIFPLARTDDRENNYTWLIHVLDDPYVLVSLKNSNVDISSLKSSKKLKIGILAGSVAEELLKKNGSQNIVPSISDIQNVKKLKLGRIDAWAAPLGCIGQYEKDAGVGINDLKVGVQITVLHEYIGASKNISQEVINQWKNEFINMKKDGTYNQILKKYGFNPL